MIATLDRLDRPVTSAGRALIRPLLVTATFMVPALVIRLTAVHPDPVASLLIFGAAVVAASFVLAWAAEAAQIDVSGGLAIAVLALIAVLPEYAVDLYYAYTAGHAPVYASYAAANMTGSNRLLMGLGWPLVVLVWLTASRKLTGRKGPTVPALPLDRSNRVELGFLLVAGVFAFVVPAGGQIHVAVGVALLAWFGFYLYKLTGGEVEEPELIGTAAAIGALPDRTRKAVVIALFAVAASVIVACAEPFARSLVAAGAQLGIDQFLLVQWLAPLASEAPEFIVAVLFAARGKGGAAIATLISSKVNQWTLLMGSLPMAHLIGGGGFALQLDTRQISEVLLTATQTLMGVALILSLRFHRRAAWVLLVLFAVQFLVTSLGGRLILCGAYLVLALTVMICNGRYVTQTLMSPFVDPAKRHGGHPLEPISARTSARA